MPIENVSNIYWRGFSLLMLLNVGTNLIFVKCESEALALWYHSNKSTYNLFKQEINKEILHPDSEALEKFVFVSDLIRR